MNIEELKLEANPQLCVLARAMEVFLNRQEEGSCPFCDAEDYPVKGKKKGYDNVSPDEAEEWNIDHRDDCLVTIIGNALSRVEKEIKKN